MNTNSFLFALSATALLAGCGGHQKRIEGPPIKTDWHRVVTNADRDRLRNWRDAWTAAMAKARAAGKGPLIDAQGPLFDPDRALPDGATPPPGHYRCRVFKIGANGPAMQDFTFYPAASCEVDSEGDVSSLYKVEGAQRPVGLLFPDTPARSVFLGTVEFGDETRPMSYGQDTSRDMAGFVERIGPARWRVIFPSPRFESLLDVVELTPAPVK